MDLALFLRVVGRFRRLVIAGFVLAVLLAFLSFVRIGVAGGKPHLSYRSNEQWESYTRLLLTQPGFKWGNSYSGAAGDSLSSQAEVEGRLPGLANIYSSFVTSDNVRRIMRRSGKIDGAVSAEALPAGPSSSSVLPIISIRAVGYTARSSVNLSIRAAEALRSYVESEQTASGVPPKDRIRLAYLNAGYDTALVVPRKKTIPIVVFLANMFAVIAIAFVLENLRPRVKTMADVEHVVTPEYGNRLSA